MIRAMTRSERAPDAGTDADRQVHAPSPIYRRAWLYEVVMRALYGRHYEQRFSAVAALIPPRSSVLELCCGPGALYRRHLAGKEIRYRGLDVNPRFVERVAEADADADVWDLRAATPLPTADYVVMQASLYHFLDDDRALVERMLDAASVAVIIAEPIHNVSAGQGWLSRLAAALTDPGTGPQPDRYDEQRLDQLFAAFRERIQRSDVLPGGREKLYLLSA
jgi:SAM-dependent methyltransferase